MVFCFQCADISVRLVLGIENTPDAHARAGNGWQLDGARETLVTLRIVVLQAYLELNGLEKVSLLLIQRVIEELLDILAHSGCGENKMRC